MATEKRQQDEPNVNEGGGAQTPADPLVASVGRMVLLAVVAVVALLQAAPFLATTAYVPKIQDQIRWVITALILFRAWQGMPTAILVTRLGLAFGAIIYLCIALVVPAETEEKVLWLFNSVVYALADLVMIYSRSIKVYLGEDRQRDELASAGATDAARRTGDGGGPAIPVHHEPGATVDKDWPRCPQCEAPRLTRCPYCRTAGTSFLRADHPPSPASFGDQHEMDVLHPSQGPSCSCGPAGCGPRDAHGIDQHASEAAEGAVELLVCPTCDEPFQPSYLRQCEWCGHDFGEGFVVESVSPQYEPVNMRIVALMIGLVIFAIGVLAYFALLVPPGKH